MSASVSDEVKTEPQPQVTWIGALDMQVCVPSDYTDEQIKDFANDANLCGTQNGWQIRREGDEALLGDPERQPCKGNRTGCVHVMLDA